MPFIPTKELSEALHASESALAALLRHKSSQSDPSGSGRQAAQSADDLPDRLAFLLRQYLSQYPDMLRTLDALNSMTTPIGAKHYYLSKVPNKRHGFVWYVRYSEKGAVIPSHWSTGTNNRALAELFARKNRESLLARYRARQSVQTDFYDLIEQYYEADSASLQNDKKRGRRLTEHNRRKRLAIVRKEFAPFLRTQRVQGFADVTPSVVARFQNRQLSKGLAPQTVNMQTGAVSAMFKQFVLLGLAPLNPFKHVERLKLSEETTKARGCHDIEKAPGVFEEPWDDPTELLLCALGYSSGIRNIEIQRARVRDVFWRHNCWFLDIPDSKTKNGVRIAPLHPFVVARLDLDRPGNAPLIPLPRSPGKIFNAANATMGYKLGMLPEQLAAEHITFYSGRHFYKTMLNAEGLGDAEEYFMGHRVSSSAAQVYNHRDRQGQKKIAEAAHSVIAILDKRLFMDRHEAPPPAC